MHKLNVVSGPLAGRTFELTRELTIGRRDADLTIRDDELSRRHVVVRPTPDGVELEDLGSLNGTFVDGRRITAPVTLTASAVFRVGTSEIALEFDTSLGVQTDPDGTRLAGIVETPPPGVPAVPPDSTRVRPAPGPPIPQPALTRVRDAVPPPAPPIPQPALTQVRETVVPPAAPDAPQPPATEPPGRDATRVRDLPARLAGPPPAAAPPPAAPPPPPPPTRPPAAASPPPPPPPPPAPAPPPAAAAPPPPPAPAPAPVAAAPPAAPASAVRVRPPSSPRGATPPAEADAPAGGRRPRRERRGAAAKPAASASKQAATAPANPFPNYTQLTRHVPIWAWHVGRVLSVAAAIGLCIVLVVKPSLGLKLWWKLAIPLLPALWLTAPGLWRNLCPLAASNQTPRLFKFTRGLTVPDWYREYAPVVGMAAFMILVASRHPLFNDSGPATAVLIGASLVGAFVGGLTFKGKSGWCSSICPLLPVQRVYGQTPYVTVPNSHCQPCVGCTKNCYDFNPRVAYLADLYEEDDHYKAYRKFFVGAFPGLVYCYFTLPVHISALHDYGRFAVYIAVSAGSFFLLEALLKVTSNKITAVYGGAAISTYYFYSSKTLAGTLLGNENTQWFVWGVRVIVWVLAAIWIVRTWRKEAVFVAQAGPKADAPVRLGGGGMQAARAEQAGNPEITFAPSGLRVVAKPGATLLELAERSEQEIEAGCRMGVCGADPICVLEGMDNLSAPASDEQGTLDRLGYAANTRMACCARINGPVTIALKPMREGASRVKRIPDFLYDPAVKRVVVVGNGIAGVTAADHVRRRHPECAIDVVANEPYPLYNRMGIARLVHGSSAMVGLQLLPDSWYEDNQITCWLNTWATKLDAERREVTLGTGETLGYDRLVLATGSDAFVPPVEGFGAAGTFVLRRAGDAFAVRDFVQKHGAKTAIVAGGGLLGLEAAYALRKLNVDVTVLERGSSLLSRQLDARSAELLRDYLQGLGLNIMVASQTASLGVSGGRLHDVVLADGRTLPADVFLVAAGISPLVDVARAAGAEIGRGIVVDDSLRTNLPDVYAIGDAAEHRGRIYGLWPAAVEQGEIAAENALGGIRLYAGTVPVTMLKVVGVDLLSVGRFAEQAGDTVIVLEDTAEHSYRKLVIADGRIVGAILIGRQADSPNVTNAVRSKLDVSAMIGALEQGDWDVLAADQAVPA